MAEWKRHGFPPGYRFAPTDTEMVQTLRMKVAGEPLPLPSVFHDLNIRDFHPQALYGKYKKDLEDGFIYFFSLREFANPNGNKRRPKRTAKDGVWKASGSTTVVQEEIVKEEEDGSGEKIKVKIGERRTMIFYDDKIRKSQWAMQEFKLGSNGQFADLAIYRIYPVRSGKNNTANMSGNRRMAISGEPSTSTRRLSASHSQEQEYGQYGNAGCIASVDAQPLAGMPPVVGLGLDDQFSEKNMNPDIWVDLNEIEKVLLGDD